MRPRIKVDASRFLNAPGRSERRRFRLPLEVDMPLVKVRQAEVEILVEGRDQGVGISGTAASDLQMNCYRCMEEWRSRTLVSFDRTVRRLPDSDGYCLPDDGWLRLDGIVIDEVVLSLPTTPLCQEDCQGICSGCGVHLNQAACGCADDDLRSPFAVLSQLL